MKLAMIEGDENHAELLRRYVKAWGRERNIPLALTSFSGTENFRLMWKDEAEVDALLIDVRLEDAEKKELTKFARRKHAALAIVFTAGFSEDTEGNSDRPQKSAGREKLFRCMDRVLHREGQREVLTVRTNGNTLELAADRIMFVKVQNGGSLVEFCPQRGHTFQIECEDSLAALEAQLNSRNFIRCHRAYIVSLDKIRRVSRACIELKNGSRIPVSRSIYSELNQMVLRRKAT